MDARNITQTLADLKRKKADLVRLVAVRKETFTGYKGENPEVSFKEITKQIKQRSDEIDELKVRLHMLNIVTEVEGKPLYAHIIRQSSVRSELANLQALMNNSEDRWLSREETKENRKVPQIDKLALNEMIKVLEEEKAKLDSIIQKANFETPV